MRAKNKQSNTGQSEATATIQSKEKPSSTSSFNAVFPKILESSEAAAINTRREKSGIAKNSPKIGVALSGGGIRSATFCLGIFQALARHRLIGKIDYLSTVSGGGYFGSFLGALFQRESPANVAGVEKALGNSNSWPVRWLRENGRYMSPNGAGDTSVFAAAMLRNWTAIHVVIMMFLLMLLTLACLARCLFCVNLAHLAKISGMPAYERFLAEHWVMSIWWSPFLILPLLSFGLVMLPAGSIYWLTQIKWLMRAVHKGAGLLVKECQGLSATEVAGRVRRLLTSALSVSLLVTLGLLAFAVVDSLGQTTYSAWAEANFSFPSMWAGLSAIGMVIFGLAQKLFAVVEKLPGRRSIKLPFNLMAALAALVWIVLMLISLSVVAHGMAWNWGTPWLDFDNRLLWPMNSRWLLAGALVVTFLFSWLFSRGFGFINLSSHQQLYAARLKRAYIGASNPERQQHKEYAVTNPLAGDEIPLGQYHPHQHGGPLHLINVTVNETISGKSQIEQRDRKGLPLAVGPSGLSVGVNDHALWANGRQEIEPVLNPKGVTFHSLHGDLSASTESETAKVKAAPTHPIESLPLGHWVAVSGAAFTTGLGAGTSMGLSLLLGLANVRLGYWWNCGVKPSDRSQRTHPSLKAQVGELFARILPVQACLFDEFLARFHGPARQHWYLSDGGHFENTGCYELIRRRCPFIIASDAGRDTQYHFEDIANLVRKSRTDFGAEIEFVRRKKATSPTQIHSSYPVPALEDVVHPDLLNVLGTPEDFAPVPGAVEVSAGEDSTKTKYSSKHAMLARVHYVDTHEFCWILFLKPSLTGDEPVDVLQYQKKQPDFPQESTMDQYFDEAQWESYRKLGEHIGHLVFAPPVTRRSPGDPVWSPSQMRPPKTSQKPAKAHPPNRSRKRGKLNKAVG